MKPVCGWEEWNRKAVLYHPLWQYRVYRDGTGCPAKIRLQVYRPPGLHGFAMTSLNGQLVLVGNHGGDMKRITVWDSHSEWVHPYPPMPTGRSMSAAVRYQNYLIVACGFVKRDIVEVLDSSSGRWYSAQPVPVGGQHNYVISSGRRSLVLVLVWMVEGWEGTHFLGSSPHSDIQCYITSH